MRITMIAPAKVNLWLRVGPRLPSGFHDLDTLFCALTLADDLVLREGEPGRGLRLGMRHGPPLQSMPDLGPVLENLAMRAARAFQDRAGGPANLRMALIKRIPAGGGLGGGSSDAAAVLRGLRRMHPDLLSADELRTLAPELGSDVPFFLAGSPFARGRGRGERLTPLQPLPPRPVVVVMPALAIPTAEAYRWLDEDRGDDGAAPGPAGAASGGPSDPGRPADPGEADEGGGGEGGEGGEAASLTWERVEARAHNDFEAPVFARHPRLGEIRDRLRDAGASIALLAGSGSSLFGVFHDPGTARAAADALARDLPDARVVTSATRPR